MYRTGVVLILSNYKVLFNRENTQKREEEKKSQSARAKLRVKSVSLILEMKTWNVIFCLSS